MVECFHMFFHVGFLIGTNDHIVTNAIRYQTNLQKVLCKFIKKVIFLNEFYLLSYFIFDKKYFSNYSTTFLCFDFW